MFRRIEYDILLFCRSSQPSKTVDNNYAEQAAHTKGTRGVDDGIFLVISDTQPTGL